MGDRRAPGPVPGAPLTCSMIGRTSPPLRRPSQGSVTGQATSFHRDHLPFAKRSQAFTPAVFNTSFPHPPHIGDNPTKMSFDQLSSLEAGRRRSPTYADDPEFQRLSQDLMNKLFRLNGNNQRLSGEVGHLGTRRDTPRVRERVHKLIEESRDSFKEVGEGVKKIQTWEDVTVCSPSQSAFILQSLK